MIIDVRAPKEAAGTRPFFLDSTPTRTSPPSLVGSRIAWSPNCAVGSGRWLRRGVSSGERQAVSKPLQHFGKGEGGSGGREALRR
jgi:hypothetical protein